ncbi:hypothetical protein [Quadrisphaera sp. DSM 44207]|uniref:hypothetical protein n=1 Tax=Quadrisphaera sp. DSM 44207 TaxID=1881057 RepID=UPI00351079BC
MCRDPDDDYLLALAESTQASLLVSGDRDLLALERPGLDVRAPRAAVDAVRYRHPWGPALLPTDEAAAWRQAEAEGHLHVLRTARRFCNILEGPRARHELRSIVTPQSLTSWRRTLRQARKVVRNRGMATRPEYPSPDIAYVKLTPDPGATVRATGEFLVDDLVILTLQRRLDLDDVLKSHSWRVHSLGDYCPVEDLPKISTV